MQRHEIHFDAFLFAALQVFGNQTAGNLFFSNRPTKLQAFLLCQYTQIINRNYRFEKKRQLHCPARTTNSQMSKFNYGIVWLTIVESGCPARQKTRKSHLLYLRVFKLQKYVVVLCFCLPTAALRMVTPTGFSRFLGKKSSGDRGRQRQALSCIHTQHTRCLG